MPYQGFPTADSNILLGGGNDRLFGVMCAKLGHPEWATDGRFATNGARVRNREILEPMIERITRTKTTKEWLDVFHESGLPYAAINDVKDTLEHPHGKL